MIISICVGSSCHLKGSYQLIELFKQAVAENQLEKDVELKAAFCLGKCTNGVSVKIDNEIICGVSPTPEYFNEFFQQNVLNKLKK